MNRILLRAWFGIFIFACVLGLALSRHSNMQPAAAGTPTPLASASALPTASSTTAPQTTITNEASATYGDGTNTYNILSNLVTVVVQNAPSMVVITDNGSAVGTTSGTTYPGDVITEYYSLVNTGNGTGTFQLATGAAPTVPTPLPGNNNVTSVNTSGVASSTGILYDVSCGSGASSLNDSTGSLAQINTDLSNANCSVAPGAAVNLAVTYTTNATGTNVQTSFIEGQLTYAALSSTPNPVGAASSLWANNSYQLTVSSDERVDIQKSPMPLATDGTETYTVTVHNAGQGPANYVNSYGTTCSTSVLVCGPALTQQGMLISDRVPVNASNTPLPVVTIVPSPGPRATPASQNEYVVYTTDTNATTGWSTPPPGGFPATTRFVGLFLTGPLAGSSVALPGDPSPPGGNSTPGAVPTGISQVGFNVKLGPIPGGLNVSNFVVAPAGDNKTTPCIEGPGLSTTATACDPSGPNPSPGSTSPGDPRISLKTIEPSNSPAPGLSNLTNMVAPSLWNGPLGAAGAQGCFNTLVTPAPFPVLSPNPYPTTGPTSFPTCSSGTGANDNMNDYSENVMPPNPAASPAYGASPAAGQALTTTVEYTVQNPTTSAVPVQLSFQSLDPKVSVSNVQYNNGANCSGGTAATYSAPYYTFNSLAASASENYCVTYTTTTGSGAPFFFQPLFVDLRISSQTAPSVYYNDTWDVLMPGGFMEIVKQANVLTTGGNPGGCTGTIGGSLPLNGVCPGGVIQYAIAYVNTLPVATSASAGSSPEPGTANLNVSAGGFTITEDGTANGSNWAAHTGGVLDPTSPPAANPLQKGLSYATMLSNCGKVTLSCGVTDAGATYGGTQGNVNASTSFTVNIPQASLTPQSVGELVFAVQVK